MYFDSQNGWIQFVFANRDDGYYLPSTLRVGLDRYLEYCLKRAGYGTVLFWDGHTEGRYELSYLDEESAQGYEKIRPKGFGMRVGGWLLGTGEAKSFVRGRRAYVSVSPENMEQIFCWIAEEKSREKTALVVPLRVFDEFSADRDRTARLLGRRERYCPTRRNLLLLTSSVMADDSNSFLTRDGGILPELSEEVRQAVIPDGSRNLYEKLSANLGEQCVFLNALNRDILRNVVLRESLFPQQPLLPADRDSVEKVTDLISCYYHSESLRGEAEGLLPENPKRMYDVVDRALGSRSVCEALLAWVREHGGEMSAAEFRNFLSAGYPGEGQTCHICSNSFLLRRWGKIRPPEDLSAAERSRIEPYMERCRTLLENLVLRGEKQISDVCLPCFESLDDSLSRGDRQTFRYGLKNLEYTLDTCLRPTKMREEVLKFYGTILELSENIWRQDRACEKYDRRIESASREIREIIRRTDRMGDGGSDEKYRAQQRAVQCSRDIEEMKGLRTLSANQRQSLSAAISRLEKSIDQLSEGGTVDVGEIVRQAEEAENAALRQNIESLNSLDATMDSGPSLQTWNFGQADRERTDIEESFRILVQSMNGT